MKHSFFLLLICAFCNSCTSQTTTEVDCGYGGIGYGVQPEVVVEYEFSVFMWHKKAEDLTLIEYVACGPDGTIWETLFGMSAGSYDELKEVYDEKRHKIKIVRSDVGKSFYITELIDAKAKPSLNKWGFWLDGAHNHDVSKSDLLPKYSERLRLQLVAEPIIVRSIMRTLSRDSDCRLTPYGR